MFGEQLDEQVLEELRKQVTLQTSKGKRSLVEVSSDELMFCMCRGRFTWKFLFEEQLQTSVSRLRVDELKKLSHFVVSRDWDLLVPLSVT